MSKDVELSRILGIPQSSLSTWKSSNQVDADRILSALGQGADLNWLFFGVAKFPKQAWNCARTRAKLDGFRWHDLRHTCASYLVQQGVGIRVVAEILGHKTLQMAMRYSHLAPDHLADGLAAAEKAMFGK